MMWTREDGQSITACVNPSAMTANGDPYIFQGFGSYTAAVAEVSVSDRQLEL